MSQWTVEQMKPRTFYPYFPMSNFDFPCNIKIARNTNRIYKDAGMWLLQFSIKKWAFFAVHTQLASKNKARTRVTFAGKITHLQRIRKIKTTCCGLRQ